MSTLSLIASSKTTVYHPELAPLCDGSVKGVLLLQSLIRIWGKLGGRPFYIFNGPCEDNEFYYDGLSLAEQTGMSTKEVCSARDAFAVKAAKASVAVLLKLCAIRSGGTFFRERGLKLLRS